MILWAFDWMTVSNDGDLLPLSCKKEKQWTFEQSKRKTGNHRIIEGGNGTHQVNQLRLQSLHHHSVFHPPWIDNAMHCLALNSLFWIVCVLWTSINKHGQRSSETPPLSFIHPFIQSDVVAIMEMHYYYAHFIQPSSYRAPWRSDIHTLDNAVISYDNSEIVERPKRLQWWKRVVSPRFRLWHSF